MLNMARIAELKAEVGEDDFAEVFDLFREEVEEVLEALPTVPQAELPGKLHFLKGSAFNIGLEGVGERCRLEEKRLIEDPQATPDIAGIRSLYDQSMSDLAG
jgi:hypothetical protein